MMTTEKTLIEIYKIANKKTKEKLKLEFPTLFGKETLLQEAINYLTEQDEEVLKLRKLETLSGIDNLVAEQKLIIIFKFKNEGWTPNWNDKNECKYMLWFNKYNSFIFHNYYVYFNHSCISSRLYLKSEKLVIQLSSKQEVIDLFKIYMNN